MNDVINPEGGLRSSVVSKLPLGIENLVDAPNDSPLRVGFCWSVAAASRDCSILNSTYFGILPVIALLGEAAACSTDNAMP